MTAREWQDLLDAFVYLLAQPIYYSLAFFLALMVLAPILKFAITFISSRNNKDD